VCNENGNERKDRLRRAFWTGKIEGIRSETTVPARPTEGSRTRSVGFECGSLFGLFKYFIQHSISAILFVSGNCPVSYHAKTKKGTRHACHHTSPFAFVPHPCSLVFDKSTSYVFSDAWHALFLLHISFDFTVTVGCLLLLPISK